VGNFGEHTWGISTSAITGRIRNCGGPVHRAEVR
jgi:hypothetical protein